MNTTCGGGDDEEGGRERKERSEEHTSELQSQSNLVCRPLLEKKKARRYHRLPLRQGPDAGPVQSAPPPPPALWPTHRAKPRQSPVCGNPAYAPPHLWRDWDAV